MCFIFTRRRTTPEDFRSVKQKNEKEENGSCMKKFLNGAFSLCYSDEPSRMRKSSCLKTCCMKLLRQLLKGLPKFHWFEKKKKTARETKVYSD
jgi:hypothetical protein